MDRKLIDWGSVIKIGNKVRIRQFDDMEKQYGYRYVGDTKVINVYMSFTEDMKKICGDVIDIDEEIEEIYKNRGYFYYQGFTISTDMLEPYVISKEEKEDLFMKIQEAMELKDGSRVRTNNGKIYIVNDGNLISEDNGNSLTVNYGLKEIFNMEFELIKVKLVDVLIPGNIVEIMDGIESRRKLGVILNNDNICYFDGGFDSLSYERDTTNDPDYYINKVYEPLIGFDLMNIKKEKMKLVWSKN